MALRQRVRERVTQADGVLITRPEYNFSVPGGLKNVLDWLSRGDDQPFATDDTTRKFVGDQMLAFQRWMAGVKRMHAAG